MLRFFFKANFYKNPKGRAGKNIKPFSEYVKQKQHELLAHTIRAANEDPLREATLEPDSGTPIHLTKRRVGRPRDNWTWSAYEELFLRNNLGTRDMFKLDPVGSAERVANRARNRDIVCQVTFGKRDLLRIPSLQLLQFDSVHHVDL